MFLLELYLLFKPATKGPTKDRKIGQGSITRIRLGGIDFPVTVKDYSKLEWKSTININVFGCENKQFYPVYVSKECNEDVLNLLLITKDEKKHSVLIKDFNSLMFNKTKHKEKKYFCMHCLQCFSSKDILTKRKTNCMVINAEQAIRMPQKGKNILQFQNYHKQMPVLFVIYADFDAITEKIQGCEPNNTQSYTDKYQKHTGCSYGYKVVCCYDDQYVKPVQIYRGEKPIKTFMEEMLKKARYCQKIIATKFKKPLKMSDKDEQHFREANECHICNPAYTNKDIRFRDHWHITGSYRGSAHQDCNLKLRINPKEFKIPVIFHNLRGYDSHFIMQEIGSIGKGNDFGD